MTVILNWRDRRHPDAGGAEVLCEELAQGLAGRGRNVYLVTAASPPNPKVEWRDGYTIVRAGSRFGVYPAALWWLWRHRRQVEAVIDSQNGIPFFSPLVVSPNTPVVLLIHHVHQDQFAGYFPAPAVRIAQFLESSVTRWVYGRRLIVAVSPSTKRDIRVRLGLRGRGLVIAPGSTPPVPRPVPDPRSESPRIVCVGRLVAHKRLDLVIAAMKEVLARFPTARLELVGDGPDRARLEDQVRDLGLASQVMLHGALAPGERDALLQTAWLTVNPSQREGWGLTVIEANGLGVPAVAFRRPGLKDSIRHGHTGWLVDHEDQLGSVLTEVLTDLQDPAFARHMADATQAWAGQFGWEAMVERFATAVTDEAQRLSRPAERRLESDLACVAEVPIDLLPAQWSPQLRHMDQMVHLGDHMTFLFLGADSDTARDALARTGLGPQVANHPRVQIRVARPVDLLSMESPALAVVPLRP
jgi:glycosyltransferase involved in cell wall biosynthesis